MKKNILIVALFCGLIGSHSMSLASLVPLERNAVAIVEESALKDHHLEILESQNKLMEKFIRKPVKRVTQIKKIRELQALERYIENSENPRFINSVPKEKINSSTFFYALRYGSKKVISFFAEYDARFKNMSNPPGKMNYHKCLIIIADFFKKQNIVDKLSNADADLRRQAKHLYVFALKHGDEGVVEFFIKNNGRFKDTIDLNEEKVSYDTCPLVIAHRSDQHKVIEKLLAFAADVELYTKYLFKNDPLFKD